MRWRSMRLGFRAAAVLLAAAFSTPLFGESPLQQLQTDNLQLIWFHPAEDYLAPHAARSFENSLAFQESLWGWKPDGKVTVLLKDFIDYGNAGATSVPQNMVLLDIAPVPYTLETFVAQRAHLLVHEPRARARGQSRRVDRGRHALAPHPRRQDRDRPEASGNAAVPLSHGAALGRAALVPRRRRGVLRDLDGRRPRPRPGRVRRDGVPRDGARQRAFLQSGEPRRGRHQGRLPGRRQQLPVRHALRLLLRTEIFAGEGRRMGRAPRRQRALLRRPVRAGVRQADGRRVERMDRLGARVPESQPRRSREVSAVATPSAVAARTRLDVARLLRPGAQGDHRRHSAIPASPPTSARCRSRTAASIRWST